VDLTSCILGKFLVVHTFVARHFQVCLDARAPSGEIWNYLLRRMYCNVKDLTPSTPFRDLILATNVRKWATGTISLHVFKASVATHHVKIVMIFAHQITCASYHFVIWIAPTEKFAYKRKFYIFFCWNWIRITAWANSIKRFLTFDK